MLKLKRPYVNDEINKIFDMSNFEKKPDLEVSIEDEKKVCALLELASPYDLLILAATKGYGNIVQFLLGKIKNSAQSLAKAVMGADEGGYSNIVKLLLTYIKDNRSDYLRFVLMCAVTNGNLNVVQTTLTIIDPRDVKFAFFMAAKEGNLKIFQTLLTYHEYTLSNLELAVSRADYNGHHDIVEMLISIGAKSSKHTIEEKLQIMLTYKKKYVEYMKSVTFSENFPIKNEDWRKLIAMIELVANMAEKLDTKVLSKINYKLMCLVTDDLEVLIASEYFSKVEGIDQFTHINSRPLFILGQYLGSTLTNQEYKKQEEKLEKGFNELKQEVSEYLKKLEKRFDEFKQEVSEYLKQEVSECLKSNCKIASPLIERDFLNLYEQIRKKVTEEFINSYFARSYNNVSNPEKISNLAQVLATSIMIMPPPTSSAPGASIPSTQPMSTLRGERNSLALDLQP